MNDAIGDEWEEDLTNSIELMTILEKETGEVLYQDIDDLSNNVSLGSIPKRANCTGSSSVFKRWRIPQEYSKLGSPRSNVGGLECNSGIEVSDTYFNYYSNLSKCLLNR